MDLFLQVVLFLVVSPAIHGQDCPELLDDDLGDTNAPSSSGLLALTIGADSGEANPNLQILDSNIVCLGQGVMRNMYQSVSVVVRYFSTTNFTAQVEYQCMNGVWGFGSIPSLNTTPIATLTTPLRTDCIICINPTLAPGTVTVTAEEHCTVCEPCDPGGLMRCNGQASSQTCCNFFDMSGNCVEVCPQNASSVNSSDCVCDPGFQESTLANTCTEINECDSGPCENEGTCSDLVNDFSCSCVSGFTGDTCMTNIDDCDSNPCKNGGTCRDQTDTFSCDCAPNFSGTNCTIQCDVEGCLICSASNVCTECEEGRRLTGAGKCEGSSNNTPVIIGVVIAVVVIVLLLIIGVTVAVAIFSVAKKGKDDKPQVETSKNMNLIDVGKNDEKP